MDTAASRAWDVKSKMVIAVNAMETEHGKALEVIHLAANALDAGEYAIAKELLRKYQTTE